jgi:hypothetical protein
MVHNRPSPVGDAICKKYLAKRPHRIPSLPGLAGPTQVTRPGKIWRLFRGIMTTTPALWALLWAVRPSNSSADSGDRLSSDGVGLVVVYEKPSLDVQVSAATRGAGTRPAGPPANPVRFRDWRRRRKCSARHCGSHFVRPSSTVLDSAMATRALARTSSICSREPW